MKTSARLTTLTRLGFAARGLLYIVIAFLVLRTGRAEDTSGALQYMAAGGGRMLLMVITAGLVGYGVWRLADAAFDIERHGASGKGLAQRVGAGLSGVVHLLLAWQAIRLIRGAASAGGDSAQQGAQTALSLPFGGPLLMLAGVVLLGVGVAQFVSAARGEYLKYLEPQIAQQPWAKWSGRLGYAARGVVFLICGVFLFRAGTDERASEAGGTAEALSWLSYPWDIVVALGLFAFGIFSLIEARFRVLHDVPVDDMARRAKGRLRV